MTRCALRTLLAPLAATVIAIVAAAPAHAQRQFERDALRGELVVKAPPDALLNGKPVRLSPGARIRSPQNTLLLSGALLEQKLRVNYRLDGFGQVHDVWILSAEEASRNPWPRSADEAQKWVFDPTMQRWSKP
jgi:hypothetical protein